jgi:hypothetical protein
LGYNTNIHGNVTRKLLVLNLKQTKMSFFSFTKSENKRAEQILRGGVGTSGRGEIMGKGHGRVNIVQILCTHVCKWKNDTCWNYSKNGRNGE